jgi:hypothetical protein
MWLALLFLPSFALAQGWTVPVNLGPGVNSGNFQTDPCLAENDTALYFDSMYENAPDDYDIRVSYYRDGAWQPSAKLGDSINRPVDREVNPFVTPDGYWLFYRRMEGPGYRLLFSERINGVWQSPRRLTDFGIPLDDSTGRDWTVHFNRSMTRCYLSSTRRGVRNPDIWMCEKAGGVWQPPTILSDSINTPGYEWKPSVNADETELYFRSQYDHLVGYFYCSTKVNGVWQGKVDMGNTINDPNYSSDGCFITGDGINFYFDQGRWPPQPEQDIWVSHRLVGVGGEKNKGSHELSFLRFRNPTGLPLEIEYSLSKPGSLRLRVYDLQGRLVSVLRKGLEGPGRQRVDWVGLDLHGRKLSNGVYFLVFETEGKTSSHKVILLR